MSKKLGTTGFRCPFCKQVGETKVVDSRSAMENEAIFRRRRCESCGERWNTYEIAAPELDNLRRATAEIYDRLKKVINRFQAIDLDVLNNGECFKVLHRFIGKD